jgi:hypothetical protein
MISDTARYIERVSELTDFLVDPAYREELMDALEVLAAAARILETFGHGRPAVEAPFGVSPWMLH